jgi:ssDNA-binding Zn-finger/Zn-ribbon topoisomerase 1
MKKSISIPKLKKKALDLYSQVIKLRAASEGKLICYTCNKPLVLKSSDCQLGHFLSRGAYPGLTFHSDNSRVQCYRCNVHLHGNVIEFRERLINEIGYNKVTALELSRHTQVKWSRSDFHEMIDRFSAEIKDLK